MQILLVQMLTNKEQKNSRTRNILFNMNISKFNMNISKYIINLIDKKNYNLKLSDKMKYYEEIVY